MPMIATRGLMSSKGFGQFGGQLVPPTPGTFAYIIAAPSSFWKYTFASDTAVKGATISQYTQQSSSRLAAVGNGVKGFFLVRKTSYGGTLATRMMWAAVTSTKDTQIAGAFFTNSIAVGNATLGVFTPTPPGQTTPSPTNVITYAGETIASGTSLLGTVINGEGAGGPDYGLFLLSGGTQQKQTNKYFYADNSVTPGANLTISSYLTPAAIGNASVGIFSSANNNNITTKYTWSNDASVVGTTLVQRYSYMGGWNNDTVGIIGGTSGANLNKWTFANDTCVGIPVSSTGLVTPQYAYGTANGISGVSV